MEQVFHCTMWSGSFKSFSARLMMESISSMIEKSSELDA